MEKLYYCQSPALVYYKADDEGLFNACAEIKNTWELDIKERVRLHKKLLQKCGIIIGKEGQLQLFKTSDYISSKAKQRLRG